jgi:hypothetical protein
LDAPKKRSAIPPTDQNSDAFILNQLQSRARKIGDELTGRFDDLRASCSDKRDPDLIEPYETATALAHRKFAETELFANDMRKIRDHALKALAEWAKEAGHAKAMASRSKKSSAGSDNISKKAAMHFAAPVDGLDGVFLNTEDILASFAYCHKWESPFPLQVAFKKLCEIKAKKSKSGIAPCTIEIDEARSIPSAFIRAVENSYAD